MAGKTFRSTAFKRAIDVGKITTVGADDLVKIWRTATGDEKAISLGDLEVGVAEGLVPYIGAISDVDLGDNSLLVESVTLNPAPLTIPTAQGSMYFDEDEQTLAVILNGVTQKVGEDNFFQVKNQSGATIPKGTAVRFDGVVGASGRIKVVPFLADGTYPSLYFAGVTDEEILNGGDGKSYILGKVRGLNTNAYPIGTILYCSSTVAGGFTNTPPIAPNNIISVAAVIAQSATVGTLLVRPQIGSNINYDEGVKIVTPTTGDILQLQSSGLWENKNLNNQYVTIATAQTITGAKVFNNPLLVLSENNPVLRITSTSNTGTLNFRNVFSEDQAGIILDNPANKFSIATRVSNTDIEIAPHGTGSILLPNIPSGTGDVLMLNGSNEVVKGSANNIFYFKQSHPTLNSKQTAYYTTTNPSDALGENLETILNPSNLIGSTSLNASVECSNNSVYLIEGHVRINSGGLGIVPTFSIRFQSFGFDIRPIFSISGPSSTDETYCVKFEITVGFTIDGGVNKMFPLLQFSAFVETGQSITGRSNDNAIGYTISGVSNFDILVGIKNGGFAICNYINCIKLK